MNKIIDKTLNLPSDEELSEENTDLVETSENKVLSNTKNDLHDQETEDIRQKAVEAFDDIMELGRNVNPERSARIFEVAGQFLKTGLDASNSKVDKQLKITKLKLEAKRLEVDDETLDSLNHGAEIIADRNALLKTLVEESDKNTVDVEPDVESDDKTSEE